MAVKRLDTSKSQTFGLSKGCTLGQPISMSNGSNKNKLIKTNLKNTADSKGRVNKGGRPEKSIDWDALKEACLKDLDIFAASGKCGVSHVKLIQAIQETYGMRFSEYKAKIQAPLKEQLFDMWWKDGIEKGDPEARRVIEKRLNKETGGDPDQSQQQINIHVKLHLDDFKQKVISDQYSTIELDQDEFTEITEIDELRDDGETL